MITRKLDERNEEQAIFEEMLTFFPRTAKRYKFLDMKIITNLTQN
jgi:hypothetical protein